MEKLNVYKTSLMEARLSKITRNTFVQVKKIKSEFMRLSMFKVYTVRLRRPYHFEEEKSIFSSCSAIRDRCFVYSAL
jgi:hypothetical protein